MKTRVIVAVLTFAFAALEFVEGDRAVSDETTMGFYQCVATKTHQHCFYTDPATHVPSHEVFADRNSETSPWVGTCEGKPFSPTTSALFDCAIVTNQMGTGQGMRTGTVLVGDPTSRESYTAPQGLTTGFHWRYFQDGKKKTKGILPGTVDTARVYCEVTLSMKGADPSPMLPASRSPVEITSRIDESIIGEGENMNGSLNLVSSVRIEQPMGEGRQTEFICKKEGTTHHRPGLISLGEIRGALGSYFDIDGIQAVNAPQELQSIQGGLSPVPVSNPLPAADVGKNLPPDTDSSSLLETMKAGAAH